MTDEHDDAAEALKKLEDTKEEGVAGAVAPAPAPVVVIVAAPTPVEETVVAVAGAVTPAQALEFVAPRPVRMHAAVEIDPAILTRSRAVQVMNKGESQALENRSAHERPKALKASPSIRTLNGLL